MYSGTLEHESNRDLTNVITSTHFCAYPSPLLDVANSDVTSRAWYYTYSPSSIGSFTSILSNEIVPQKDVLCAKIAVGKSKQRHPGLKHQIDSYIQTFHIQQ